MNISDRKTYDQIKNGCLQFFYHQTISLAHKDGDAWTYLSIMAYHHEECYYRSPFSKEIDRRCGGYSRLVEYFMLELVSLVMSGAWSPVSAQYHKKKMREIIDICPWQELFSDVPEEEESLVKQHLDLLSLSDLYEIKG